MTSFTIDGEIFLQPHMFKDVRHCLFRTVDKICTAESLNADK